LTTDEPAIPKPVFPLRFRWLIWLAVVIGWTIALLTTPPVDVAHAVLAEEMIFPVSKLLHVIVYALLAVLSGWLQVPFRFRWLLLLFMSLHAVGTEFFQQFIPKRGPSVWDVGSDHIGIILGLAVSWKWWWNSRGLSGKRHGD
jgi:VanZ family protein